MDVISPLLQESGRCLLRHCHALNAPERRACAWYQPRTGSEGPVRPMRLSRSYSPDVLAFTEFSYQRSTHAVAYR